jgi:GTPase SAR1 family protein
MCLCLGPTGSGKTLLLKKLQNWEAIDTMSSTVPTVGTNLVTVPLGNQKEITIREVGGAMAPIWRNYYYGIQKIVYVVDASNLCQISAAGVLLYTVLAEPCLRKAKVENNFLYR